MNYMMQYESTKAKKTAATVTVKVSMYVSTLGGSSLASLLSLHSYFHVTAFIAASMQTEIATAASVFEFDALSA